MRFRLEFSVDAQREFERLKVYKRRRVLDAIKLQLGNEPDVPSRNRKSLGDHVTANFEYVPPLWELRIDDVRVFYEVVGDALAVTILAVRFKPPSKTTSRVLNEADED